VIISAYGNVGLVMLALLPLAALVVWGLARLRLRAGSTTGVAWRLSLAEVGIVYGTLPWLWLIAQPGSSDRLVDRAVHLDPLRDLVTMPPYQIIGNLLVFAALGFFAPMRFGWVASVPRVLALAAVCSLLVEISQYAAGHGRVSSLDDVLLNSAGAGLAALASHRWRRPLTRRT